MAGLDSADLLAEGSLRRIFSAHGLGDVRSLSPLPRGGVNPGAIVNNAYIIRFDLRSGDATSRFISEVDACQRLQASGVPVPEVVAIDLSREVVPYPYLITVRLPGVPLIDRWADLSASARRQTARLAGRFLALIHQSEIRKFGNLHDIAESGGWGLWLGYVGDYLRRYSRQAVALGVVDPFLPVRAQAALLHHRATLAGVTAGRLVHSDYHFENILVDGDAITGVLDFEWALSGDPSWDFIVEDKWEAMCPGSRRHIYEGYEQVSALAPDHDLRVKLYQLPMYVEWLVDFTRRGDSARAAKSHRQMLAVLDALEEHPPSA